MGDEEEQRFESKGERLNVKILLNQETLQINKLDNKKRQQKCESLGQLSYQYL